MFISGIFHLIFQTPVDYVTEKAESKTTNKVWNYCILQLLHTINISLVKSFYQRKVLQKLTFQICIAHILHLISTLKSLPYQTRQYFILSYICTSIHSTILNNSNELTVCKTSFQFSQFSSVVSDSLQPLGLQHARPPCPSSVLRVYSNSCSVCQWCHPTISSSVVPFSSHLQSFPASGSFQMSQFFLSGGQNIGVSASASVLPMNIQDWFPLGWTGWISLQTKGLPRVFSNTTVQKQQFCGAQLFLYSNFHIHPWLLEKP